MSLVNENPVLNTDEPCPGCGKQCYILHDGPDYCPTNFRAECCGALSGCGYRGPFTKKSPQEAIRLHNLLCRPNPETQADYLAEYFQKLRFAPEHHLGGGDIRLTMAQQDEVVAMCRLGRSPVEAVPVSALRELEAEHRAQAAEGYRQADMQPQGSRMNLDMKMKAAVHLWSADRLSAVIRGTKT